ncbi:MAG: SpoIIE family protein phosphatase [Bacteroidota bacterium]
MIGSLQRIFVIISFLVVSCNAFTQLYTFKNYNHRDGLTLSSVLTVNEDKYGYLWFGTDGAGLMRFDGKKFDYLEDIQGRTNRHVNAISFAEDRLFFSTLFRSNFTLFYDRIDKLDYITQYGQNHLILEFEEHQVVLQDGGVFIFDDSTLIHERKTFPYNEQTHYYGSLKLDRGLFLFTSKGNFVIHEERVENLHDWLGTDRSMTEEMVGGFQSGDSLVLANRKLDKELTILMDGFRPKFFVDEELKRAYTDKDETVIKSAKRFNKSVYITNQGNIILKDQSRKRYVRLVNNSTEKIVGPTDVFIDRNRDIWVTTRQSGIFRISLEPFTKINFNEVYRNTHIAFIGRTKDYDAIISVGEGQTYIGNRYNDTDFTEHEDLSIKSLTQFGGRNFVASNKGLWEVKNTKFIRDPAFGIDNNTRLTLVFGEHERLWYAVEGKGLYYRDERRDTTKHFNEAPAYFYTAIFNADSSKVLFGSNNGVFEYDISSDEFKKLPQEVNGTSLGAYVGNSAQDSFGTCWFSLDEGLLGFTKSGEVKAITAQRFLPSTLIYTLNTDENGNLIVGSNKGITVIRVNAEGNPKSSNTYNQKNGFGGYETHMRSSFKTRSGTIYVGTLEGLFMIRPEYFKKNLKPVAPRIRQIKNKDFEWYDLEKNRKIFNADESNVSFQFKSINTKSSFVKYSYKLEGLENAEWSDWSAKEEVFFDNLNKGKYTFKVRSTLDEELVSDVSTFSFQVYEPFYTSKWFIIIVIGTVILANFLVLERTKSFNKKNIILSRDVGADRRMAGSILLFGAFANTAAHIFAPRLDETIEVHDLSSILLGVIVFAMFLLVTFNRRFMRYSNEILIIGFLALLGYNHLLTFLSDIHPFYFMATLIVAYVAPFVFRSLKSAIAFSFVLMLASVAAVFYLDNAVYNQYLFLVGIAVAAFLVIFMTYLRNNSLERLIFTSGVVNKGNALVVAFDGNGKISYSSENIEELLDLQKSLRGHYITELNRFQPEIKNHKKFSNIDLKEDFQEGKIFVTPLFTKNNEIVYYQWSCKEFSKDVRVILGQDVTDKINLENYYELIVRNADDLIFQTDPNGNFTFVNEKGLDVLDRKYEDLIGTSIAAVIPEKHRARVQEFYTTNFKDRKKNDYIEFPIETADGTIKWLGQNLTTLLKPGADNIVTGFLGLARDITERRKANSIIKEQNKDITASINYARRIQFNMLPRSSEFERIFQEHFILFKPKDIVSGDFYWLNEVDDKTILICSDSTGHGVPGSFMTLLGINILNQVILEAGITDPGKIFNELDARLKQVLPRDGQNRIKDGMEAVVCVFDHHTSNLMYSTAGGRFVVTDEDNDKIQVFKGQSKHIGDEARDTDFSYETQEMSLSNQQALYLFSDGYPDQFGGEKNKKLSIKKFLALLDALTPQDMQEQNEIFREHLSAWIGDEPQTDDITVIGLRGLKARK